VTTALILSFNYQETTTGQPSIKTLLSGFSLTEAYPGRAMTGGRREQSKKNDVDFWRSGLAGEWREQSRKN
jgi:hypothetical protein